MKKKLEKRLVDYESFLLGLKPALLASSNIPPHMANFHRLKHYPSVTEGVNLHNKADFYLFFQTESLKRDFLEKQAKVEHLSPEFHELLGITLGYPPLAAKYFAELHRLEEVEKHIDAYEELFKHKVSFVYSGIRCGGHVKDLVENSVFLWERYYKENEPFKIGIIDGEITRYHDVKPFDFEGLDKIKQLKLETMKQTLQG